MRTWALFICLSLPWTAHAVLGGTVETVESTRQAMGGIHAKAVQSGNQYTVHDVSNDGQTVREYVSTGGQVFAVTWRGVGHPDFSTLFGSYFNDFNQAEKSRLAIKGHRRTSRVSTSDIEVIRDGHARDMHGVAYLKNAVPAGVNPEALP